MKIEINIPELKNFKYSEYDIKMIIGISLYEKHILSSGYAAEAIGIGRGEFINKMGKYGKSIIDLPIEEIKKDIKNHAFK